MADVLAVTGLDKIDDAIKQASKKMSLHPFKPKQLEAIRTFMSGNDTFVSLPTGYGKSAIYAVLPLAFDCLFGMLLLSCYLNAYVLLTERQGSLAVEVSPLTSLMMDQRQQFAPTGLTVEFVGEAQKDIETCSRVVNGDVQLVYISPESLLNTKKYWQMFQTGAYQEKMIAFVVDEAHCVRMW